MHPFAGGKMPANRCMCSVRNYRVFFCCMYTIHTALCCCGTSLLWHVCLTGQLSLAIPLWVGSTSTS